MTCVSRDAYKLFLPRQTQLFFFTLLLQSRPNTPPRAICHQILVRRVASGNPLESSIDFPSIEDLKEDGPEITTSGGLPTCNVRARSVVTCQFEYKQNNSTHCFCLLLSLFHQQPSSLLNWCSYANPIFDNPYPPTVYPLGRDQHVSLFPFPGSGAQGGQTEQEVISRAYEVEVAAEAG